MRINPAKLLKLAAGVLVIAMTVYIGVSIYVANILWHPARKALHTTPSQYGLQYEDVQFTSVQDNILLRGWFIDSPGAKTILVMHGSGSVRDNFINMEMSRALVQNGYDVLLFDFRGHGESGGDTFSLGAWETRDIAGALAFLKGRGVTEAGVLAYSMGASAALLAAPDHPEMRAIVADSAFADLFTILDRERAKVGYLPAWFNPGIIAASKVFYGIDPQNNRPDRAIAQLGDRPTLIIHSTGDALIPVSEAYKLQEAGAGNPNLELWITQGSGHVSSFAENKEEYLKRVIGFFDKNLAGR